MLRLKDTRHAHTRAFLKSAIKLAEYYGFSPLEEAWQNAPSLARPPKGRSALTFVRRDERFLIPIARRCAACIQKQPTALLWRIGTVKKTPETYGTALELHVVGVPNPIAEALLILLTDRIADRKSTRLNSSHRCISHAVFCLDRKSVV